MSGRILIGPNSPIKIKYRTIGELIFEMANIHGPKVCQIDFETGEEETFDSVKKRSIRAALELQKRGVTSNDVIAFCSYNILDNCIPLIATAYLGATFSSLDPDLSVRDVKHLLGLIKPKFIFVDEESLDLIEKSLDNARLETQIVVFGDSTKYSKFNEFLQPSKDEDSFKPIIVDSNQTAAILFSSGTTGLPKPIRLSHLNLFHSVNEVNNDGGTPSFSVIHFTTLYWFSGLLILLRCFSSGSYRVLIMKFHPQKAFKAIQKYKINFLMVSPTIAGKLVHFDYASNYTLGSVIAVYVGGGKISRNIIDELKRIFINAIISSPYGTTEIGMITMFENTSDGIKLNQEKVTSCGKVASRVMVKVVDPETEEILRPNQNGEIRCKSPGLMLGYIGVDLTEVLDKDGFYKTGDIGYYDDDECFFIVDRIKETFKYLSYHISPTTIEMILLEHPFIVDACVFGLPISGCEEDGEYPTAFVVLKQNHTASADEIIKFVDERVIDRERLRGGVKIVDFILKTPTDKIRRKTMRDNYLRIVNNQNKQNNSSRM